MPTTIGENPFFWIAVLSVITTINEMVRSSLRVRHLSGQVAELTRIIAARNYVEYARAERILKNGEVKRESVGDGYTAIFEDR